MNELSTSKEILDVEDLENSVKELSISENLSKHCTEEKIYDKKIDNSILSSSNNKPTSKKAIITKFKCNKAKHIVIPKIESVSVEEPRNELVKEEPDFIQKFSDLSVTSLSFDQKSDQECSPKILERGKGPSSKNRKSSNTRGTIYTPPVRDKNAQDKLLHWNGGTITHQPSTPAKAIITVPFEYKNCSTESPEINYGSPESGYGSPQSSSCLSPLVSDSSCHKPVELEDPCIKEIYYDLIDNSKEKVHASIPPEELDDALNDVNDIIESDGLPTSEIFPGENVSNSNGTATFNTNINIRPNSVLSNVAIENDVQYTSNIFHENSRMLNSNGSTFVNSNINGEPKGMINSSEMMMKDFGLTTNGFSCNENLVSSNPNGPAFANNNVEPKNLTQNVIMVLQPVNCFFVTAEPKTDLPKQRVIRPILPKPASEESSSKASQRRNVMKLNHNKTAGFIKEILDKKRENEKQGVIFVEDPLAKRSNLHMAVIKQNLERVYSIVETHLHYVKPTEPSKVIHNKLQKGKKNPMDALHWLDTSNKTAFDYAKETKSEALVEYLKQAGAEPERQK